MKNLLFLFTGTLVWILMSCAQPKADGPAAAEGAATDTSAQAPAEFADPKYTEIGKSAFAAMAAGDMATWSNLYADDAVYRWNNGDSLSGKAAISEWWTKRRMETIDSISFSEQIFLPVKVNKPQATESAGTWLLSWYRVDSKYKNGKRMNQWMHMVMHFDANDKIDQAILYRDNALILAATAK